MPKRRMRIPIDPAAETAPQIVAGLTTAIRSATAAGVPVETAKVQLVSRINGSGLAAVRLTWTVE